MMPSTVDPLTKMVKKMNIRCAIVYIPHTVDSIHIPVRIEILLGRYAIPLFHGISAVALIGVPRSIMSVKDWSVWLFTRPLTYAIFSPPVAASSERVHQLRHWGILVNEMTLTDLKVILSRTMGYIANDNTELGTMFELFQGEQCRNKVSITQKFGMNSVRKEWRMFSMQYVGKTGMTYDEIKKEGIFDFLRHSLAAIRIIDVHPDYDIFENNCQNFAKYLLEAICPDAPIPQTIADVLQRLQNIECLTEISGTLPGAYPLSVSPTDDDSFVTASSTYWFTATATSWITAVDYSLLSLNESRIPTISHSINQSTVPKRNIVARGFAAIQKRLIPRMALIQAGRNGDVKRVKTLLDLHVDIHIEDKYGKTVLYYAVENGHEPVVRLLLEQGADVNSQGGDFGNALQAASFMGREPVVRLLLEQGADVNARGGSFANALQVASSKGYEPVLRLLLEHVDPQGGFFDYALQAASFKGHEPVVRLLLKQGADVNAQGGFFGNALQAASCEGHESVVRLLLEHGADVNAQGGDFGNALQAASFEDHEPAVLSLLAHVNAQGGFFGNALQAASYEGHEPVVRLLLEQGADIDAQGGFCGNALQAASSKGHEPVVQLLLDQGADVNMQGGFCGNALQAASSNGHGPMLQLLLEHGGDVNMQGGILGQRPTGRVL